MIKYFNKIYKNSADNFHNLVKENLLNENKMFIVTANPETLITAEDNKNFKKLILDDKTTIIADGIGVVKGGKLFNQNIKETIPGIELCSKLFEYCNELKKSIFLFGAQEEVVKKLINVITVKYPKVKISGYENGYIENKQTAFEKIAPLNPDVILVALGIPEQEFLIYNHLDKFNKGIFVGVGGSFDVLSGAKKRAPKVLRNLHLEWLYRITKEPKRFKKFFNSNVKYFLKIIKTKRG